MRAGVGSRPNLRGGARKGQAQGPAPTCPQREKDPRDLDGERRSGLRPARANRYNQIILGKPSLEEIEMPFTLNSTVSEIMANPQARAVLDKHIPGASTHPQLSEAMYMSIREVSMYPQSGLTREKLQALMDDLAQIPS